MYSYAYRWILQQQQCMLGRSSWTSLRPRCGARSMAMFHTKNCQTEFYVRTSLTQIPDL